MVPVPLFPSLPKKRTLILCVMDGGGQKIERQPEQPANLVYCDQCLAARTKKKSNSHSGLHVRAHILALQTPLDFL